MVRTRLWEMEERTSFDDVEMEMEVGGSRPEGGRRGGVLEHAQALRDTQARQSAEVGVRPRLAGARRSAS